MVGAEVAVDRLVERRDAVLDLHAVVSHHSRAFVRRGIRDLPPVTDGGPPCTVTLTCSSASTSPSRGRAPCSHRRPARAPTARLHERDLARLHPRVAHRRTAR